ncbi:hypothetical protein [uncultured Arcticibacterium sp.]|uniref:hypothetical protein n=1 Tax=uncultured Arcticibacterium sp. TaxID=2173042 RepID=UPI0030F89AA4
MKKYFSLFILLAACTTTKNIEPNQEIEIKEESTQEFIINGKTNSIRLSKIEDSRCPENVVCVWAGEAVVTFDLLINKQPYSNLQLCLQCDQETGIPQELNIENQTITLVAVNPFPNTENVEKEQIAIFKVN